MYGRAGRCLLHAHPVYSVKSLFRVRACQFSPHAPTLLPPSNKYLSMGSIYLWAREHVRHIRAHARVVCFPRACATYFSFIPLFVTETIKNQARFNTGGNPSGLFALGPLLRLMSTESIRRPLRSKLKTNCTCGNDTAQLLHLQHHNTAVCSIIRSMYVICYVTFCPPARRVHSSM